MCRTESACPSFRGLGSRRIRKPLRRVRVRTGIDAPHAQRDVLIFSAAAVSLCAGRGDRTLYSDRPATSQTLLPCSFVTTIVAPGPFDVSVFGEHTQSML